MILTTNLFGDNLSDAASEIAGGLGLAESINAGDNFCIAQAQHGSAPDIAGKNIANPVSMIGSVAMLLDWLGKKNNNDQLKKISQMIGFWMGYFFRHAQPHLIEKITLGNGKTQNRGW